MKNTKKKGFTIVELVIVIAVIAILAAVTVPTFTNVVAKANQSAVIQAAQIAYTETWALDMEDGVLNGREGNKELTLDSRITYKAEDGAVVTFVYTDSTKGYKATLDPSTGEWSVETVE